MTINERKVCDKISDLESQFTELKTQQELSIINASHSYFSVPPFVGAGDSSMSSLSAATSTGSSTQPSAYIEGDIDPFTESDEKWCQEMNQQQSHKITNLAWYKAMLSETGFGEVNILRSGVDLYALCAKIINLYF